MKLQSGEDEYCLIATALITDDKESQSEALCKVDVKAFSDNGRKGIWQSMRDLHDEGEVVDVVSVSRRANYSMSDLAEIVQSHSFLKSNLMTYADRVAKGAFVRDARQRLVDALEFIDSFEDLTNIEEVPAAITESFDGLELDTGEKGARSFKEIAREYIENINAKLNNDPSIACVMTGMEDFDNITGGFNKDDLIVVGAPPGMGKTAFVVKMMKTIAMNGGSTLMESLEMGDQQIAERAIGVHGNISLSNLRSPQKLEEAEWQRLSVSIGDLSATDLYIHDKAGLTVEDIVLNATRHKDKFPNTKAIVIDHLGLMILPKADTRAIALGLVTARLKRLAKDLQVPVVILCQLNEKEINKRSIDNRRPVNSDIKDSSRIVEDADLIVFVYRHTVHDENAPPIVELILGKARHSEQGAKCYMRFWNGNLLDMEQHSAFNQIDAYEQSVKKKSSSTFRP